MAAEASRQELIVVTYVFKTCLLACSCEQQDFVGPICLRHQSTNLTAISAFSKLQNLLQNRNLPYSESEILYCVQKKWSITCNLLKNICLYIYIYIYIDIYPCICVFGKIFKITIYQKCSYKVQYMLLCHYVYTFFQTVPFLSV